jgi:hypothetical protein
MNYKYEMKNKIGEFVLFVVHNCATMNVQWTHTCGIVQVNGGCVAVCVGCFVGVLEGAAVGSSVGAFVGWFVGACAVSFVGGLVGAFVGFLEGAAVGSVVGAFVGWLVCRRLSYWRLRWWPYRSFR